MALCTMAMFSYLCNMHIAEKYFFLLYRLYYMTIYSFSGSGKPM